MIVLVIIIMILVLILSLILYKITKKKNEFINQWIDNAQKTFNNQYQNQLDQLDKLKNQYNLESYKLETINNEINTKQQFNSSLLKIREDELNRLIEEKKKTELSQLQNEIDEWAESAQEAAAIDFELESKDYENKILEKNLELINLEKEIEDYRTKRDVINQEILRSRAIEEDEDFYKIQLSESVKHDLQLLSSFRNEFLKIDSLDKLIYDGYIKAAVDEMTKRILQGRAPSGIYKITRLKTGEVYIGKSTDIKSRWQQHCKSCYHCGTISHSTLHDTMQKDGIWNFTFELLEEVPKDKLTEREKYWINFYDSKNYGLNQREG